MRNEAKAAIHFCLVSVFAVIVLLAAGPAATADFHVNSFDDHLDYTCDESDCSLRDAVYLANLSVGPDLIHLPAGTFTLDEVGGLEDAAVTGDLDITDSVIIGGQGEDSTIIDASALGDRVFDVDAPGKNVGFALLTITGGDAAGVGGIQRRGGGIYAHESSTLTVVLDSVTVSGNSGSYGGGIYVRDGILTVGDSVISGNTATYGGGGISAGQATLTVTNSTITGNDALSSGGGLDLLLSDATVYGTTISYNSAGAETQGGGGLMVSSTPNSVDVGNSTIYGNTAVNTGSAIYIMDGGVAALASVTIAENQGGPVFAVYNDGTLETVNTLISGSCFVDGGAVSVSYGGNLESPLNTCMLDGAGDQVAVPDAMLNPLADNGGSTFTALPLPDSPAVDNGTVDYCSPVDQRGLPRSDGACDCGAVELQVSSIFSDGFESSDTTQWSATVP